MNKKKIKGILIALGLVFLLSACSERKPEKVGAFWDSGSTFTEIPEVMVNSPATGIYNTPIVVTKGDFTLVTYGVEVDASKLNLKGIGPVAPGQLYGKETQISVKVVPSEKTRNLYTISPEKPVQPGNYVLLRSDRPIYLDSKVWAFKVQ